MGLEPVLFEYGNVAFDPYSPLDEPCYGEAATCDVMVLIIGGRYGSPASDVENRQEEYESITKKEHDTAVRHHVPVYTLIEANVYSEYHTYLKNSNVAGFQPVHADDPQIFRFIESILSRPRGNPVHPFRTVDDITSWLKAQWTGRFRELLRRERERVEIEGLNERVQSIYDLLDTLTEYVQKSLGKNIEDEDRENLDRRIHTTQSLHTLSQNRLVRELQQGWDARLDDIVASLKIATTPTDFLDKLADQGNIAPTIGYYSMLQEDSEDSGGGAAARLKDLNDARQALGLDPFDN